MAEQKLRNNELNSEALIHMQLSQPSSEDAEILLHGYNFFYFVSFSFI